MGISYEVKAFYDILEYLCQKYHFTYPDDKLKELAKRVKEEVEKVKDYPAWQNREDTRSKLKYELVVIFKKFNYPPIDRYRDEVFKEIFKQALNYKAGLEE
jgi:type I restriction enzyme R subunit